MTETASICTGSYVIVHLYELASIRDSSSLPGPAT